MFRKSVVPLFVVMTVVVLGLSLQPAAPDVQAVQTLDPSEYINSNCRVGVSSHLSSSAPWMDTIGAGWYVDFQPTNEDAYGAQIARMIRVRPRTATFSFNNLDAGTYQIVVGVASLPSGLQPTYDIDGLGAGSLNRATVTLEYSNPPANSRVQARTDVDFGYGPNALSTVAPQAAEIALERDSLGIELEQQNNGLIRGDIWLDGNSDGILQGDEEYLPDITVFLQDEAGNTLATTTTVYNSSKGYRFTNNSFDTIAAENPGSLWLVGNEVDRQGQDGVLARYYAEAYHEAYTRLKAADPTALVAISGLVQVTPLRLAYLDLVWDEYLAQFGSAMPVDVWNMHVYVLPEVFPDGRPNGIASVPVDFMSGDTELLLALGRLDATGDPARCGNPQDQTYCFEEHDDLSIFEKQVRDMRSWMADKGLQHEPLILSEFGLLYNYITDENGQCEFLMDEFGQCFDPPRVSDFLSGSFDFMYNMSDPAIGMPGDNNRLVQKWLWFSMYNNGVGDSSNLLIPEYTDTSLYPPGSFNALSEIGQRFRTEVNSLPISRNLAGTTSNVTTVITPPAMSGTVTLRATMVNNGNYGIDQPIDVTFYADAALTQVIGTVTVTLPVEGCALRDYEVSVPWSGLAEGIHPFWVQVDSSNVVSVSDGDVNSDNVAQGFAYVGDAALHLPLINR